MEYVNDEDHILKWVDIHPDERVGIVGTARRKGHKVGIYGGSFNPPHMGHVYMLLSVLQTQALDQLWILPCADHPFKDHLAPFEQRVDMCRLAFEHLRGVHVLTVEDKLPKPNYTVQTLSALKEACPEVDFSYIIGGDLVEEIPEWNNAEGLSDLAQVVVVPRQGHPVVDAPAMLGEYVEVDLGFQLPEVSSSRIIKMMRRGASVEGFIDKEVLRYIEKSGLYHDSE